MGRRDSTAGDFARDLYSRLQAGSTLGEAVMQTRRAAFAGEPGDPTWLAYTVYRDPVPPPGSWPSAGDARLPVDELVAIIKSAIKTADISVTVPDRDLAVRSVSLKLNTVATRTVGGGFDFRVPFIGMPVKAGVRSRGRPCTR